ncbi:MAG: SPOR domain-containing protein [Pseudomonadota bacterium]
MSEETKTRLEVWSLRFDLLIKLLICGLIVGVIAGHEWILNKLHSGPVQVSQVEVFGLKFKIDTETSAGVEALQQKLADTLDEVGTLQANVDNLTGLLTCQANSVCDGDQDAAIAELTGTPATVRAPTPIIAELQESVIAAEPNDAEWLIVVGADKSLPRAEDELRKLTDAGYNGQIVRRGTWLRTIARFPNGDEAQAAESNVRQIMGRQVFVLAFANWCKSPTTGDDDLLVCQK